MPHAGFCAECGGNAWLDEGGGCVAGHSANSVSGAYEVALQDCDLPAAASGRGLTGKLATFAGSTGSLTPAQLRFRDARIEYERTVKAATKEFKAVCKTWDDKLRKAEKSLAEANAYGTRKLGQCGGVVLYEHALVTPHGTIDLESDPASATVDSAGSIMETRRTTLTRMATGGLLFGPLGALGGGMVKKKGKFDSRELYLVIESGSVASIVQCDPNAGPQVRQFAMSINNASRTAPAIGQQRRQSVAQWSEYLDRLRGEHSIALAQASAALETVKTDQRALEAAHLDVAREAADATGAAG